jgi:hypothetical protein
MSGKKKFIDLEAYEYFNPTRKSPTADEAKEPFLSSRAFDATRGLIHSLYAERNRSFCPPLLVNYQS